MYVILVWHDISYGYLIKDSPGDIILGTKNVATKYETFAKAENTVKKLKRAQFAEELDFVIEKI